MLANGKPGDFFDAVIDDRVICLTCNQINVYAIQYRTGCLDGFSEKLFGQT